MGFSGMICILGQIGQISNFFCLWVGGGALYYFAVR